MVEHRRDGERSFYPTNTCPSKTRVWRQSSGKCSSAEVLGWVPGIRFRAKDLERAFFSERRARVLYASGYVTLMRWRLYAEEGLAGKEADLWLLENTPPM